MYGYELRVFNQDGSQEVVYCKDYQDCKNKFDNEYKQKPIIAVLAFKWFEDKVNYHRKYQCVGLRRNTINLTMAKYDLDE